MDTLVITTQEVYLQIGNSNVFFLFGVRKTMVEELIPFLFRERDVGGERCGERGGRRGWKARRGGGEKEGPRFPQLVRTHALGTEAKQQNPLDQ
ncbi:hypothetical protein BaRGS_00002786 [Batillaria attramentaria]|uniref:Uncharacterized protein n=1 Tax=Batillaria attramentaria TaxID=370345 RepID=A0ABD0M3X5_9CAEN